MILGELVGIKRPDISHLGKKRATSVKVVFLGCLQLKFQMKLVNSQIYIAIHKEHLSACLASKKAN